MADDGFSITKLDCDKRGGGMIHGFQQSGFNSFRFAVTLKEFKVVSSEFSDEIIEKARSIQIPEIARLFFKSEFEFSS